MTLKIIATGGTFDKHYDEIKGQLTFGATHLTDIIARVRLTAPVNVDVCCLLDSLDMVEQDRLAILQSCAHSNEKFIVIIHGTDTMRETAEVLGVAALDKTIVFTGAMIPYEIANSDALFNLGFACGVAQTLPVGVYVAMNGQVFLWDNVQKNKAAGVFSEKK